MEMKLIDFGVEWHHGFDFVGSRVARQLRRWLGTPKRKEMNIENEGESHDVVDNKGPNFLSHDVTDNKVT